MVRTVKILGATYKVYLGVDPKKDESLTKLYGYCCPSEKHIKVVDINKLSEWNDYTAEAKARQNNENIRHEIIHAFLYESGLWSSSMQYGNSWAMNEEMVDWIAIQYPKIKRVYEILNCEG